MRRLWALVQGLPRDAAVWREDIGGWSMQDELAAAQVEVTDQWGRILAQAWGVKRQALPEPVRLDHPDRRRAAAAPKGKVIRSIDELAAWFGRRGR